MIERKRELFQHGLGLFALQYCRGDRDAYISGMVHMGGYLACAKQFFNFSGYLTQDDAKALLENDVMPGWMVEEILDVEQKVFGSTIYDKQ